MDPEFESVFSKTMAQMGNPPPEVQAKYRKKLEQLYPAAKQIKAARDKEASDARKAEAKAKAEAGKKELELMGKTDWSAGALGAAQGLAFGATPAIYGAASALGQGASDLLSGNAPSLEALKERYLQMRDTTQEEVDKAKYTPEFTFGDTAGQIAGVLAPVGAGIGTAAKVTKAGQAVAKQTLKGTVAKGAATGAVTGGIEGAVTAPLAMESPKGEFLPLGDLLLESGKGGLVGAGFGATLGGLAAGKVQQSRLPIEGKIVTESYVPNTSRRAKIQNIVIDYLKTRKPETSPILEKLRPKAKKVTSYINPEQYPTISPEAPKNVPAGPIDLPPAPDTFITPVKDQRGEFQEFSLFENKPVRQPQGPQQSVDLPEPASDIVPVGNQGEFAPFSVNESRPVREPAGPQQYADLPATPASEIFPINKQGEFAPFDVLGIRPGVPKRGPRLAIDLPDVGPLPKLNPFEPNPFKLDIQEQLNLDKLRREAGPTPTESLVPEADVSPPASPAVKPKPTGRESARINFLEPVFEEVPKAEGFSKVAEPVKASTQSLTDAMSNVEKSYGSLENIFEASRSGDPVASQYIEALAQSFEGGTGVNSNATQVVSFPDLKAFELKTQPQRKKLNLDLGKTEVGGIPSGNSGKTQFGQPNSQFLSKTKESPGLTGKQPVKMGNINKTEEYVPLDLIKEELNASKTKEFSPLDIIQSEKDKTKEYLPLDILKSEQDLASQPKPTALGTKETFSLQGEKYGKGEDKSAAIKEIAGKIKSSSKSKEELTALIQETIAKYNIQPDSSFMKKLSDQIARKGAPPGKRGRPKKSEAKTKETPALTKEEADKAKLRKEAIIKKLMEEE
jgi:hypothetical protein